MKNVKCKRKHKTKLDHSFKIYKFCSFHFTFFTGKSAGCPAFPVLTGGGEESRACNHILHFPEAPPWGRGASLFFDLFQGLANVEVDRAVKNATAAPHTRDLLKVLRKVVKLVHQSLSGPLASRRSWVMT